MKTICVLQVAAYCVLLILQTGECQREENFCYNEPECGPASWTGLCRRGRMQSPIDLSYNFVDFLNAEERELLESGAYFEPQNFFVRNTGHTVSAQLRMDLTSTTYISGSLLGGTYVFSQMHFHWGSSDDIGSEHTLRGWRKPMEAHLVHYSNRFPTVHAALTSDQPGAIVVIAVFFEMSSYDNPALTSIVSKLRQVVNTSSEALATVPGTNLRLSKFLSQNPFKEVEVVQYMGSLTTPDCAEVVQWNIMLPTIPISQNQLNEFRRLRNRRGRPLVDNFRPMQRRNGRRVQYFITSIAG